MRVSAALIGHTAVVLRELLEAGLLHGDCLTVTGKTLAENLKDVPSIYSRPQKIVMPLDKPLAAKGYIAILHGNLAPDGAVAGIRDERGPVDACHSLRLAGRPAATGYNAARPGA